MFLTSQRVAMTVPVAPKLSLALLVACCALPAHADVYTEGTAVTVTPGARTTIPVQKGLRVAVVAATDTGGDVATAKAALIAANAAIARSRGYVAVTAREVEAAFDRKNMRGPLNATDFTSLGKTLKAPRALTVTINRGAGPTDQGATDPSATATALVEMYDTISGGMIGRGESTFTATAEATTPTAPPAAPGAAASARSQTLAMRAISSAVYQAFADLNRPILLHGVVVSLPAAYQARLSVGERNGLRNGAQLEYLANGNVIGHGTVLDVGAGESVASVTPEAGFSSIFVNTEFRTISNPPGLLASQTKAQKDDAEFRRFERDFFLGIAAAGLIYYGAGGF
jgi:hypothetical protein